MAVFLLLVAALAVAPATASIIALPATIGSGLFQYRVSMRDGTPFSTVAIAGPHGTEEFSFGGIDTLDDFAVSSTGIAVLSGRYYGESFLRYASYGYGGSASCPTTPLIAAGPCGNLLSRGANVGEAFGVLSWFASGRYSPAILHLDPSGHLVTEIFVDDVGPLAGDVSSFWVPYSVDLPGIHNPEPRTAVLMLSGLLVLGLRRFRYQ